ncbi:fibroleukin-like [Saccostrea cucullata]|uniref:fibroleukin-like n=1 Tax=Saccostrea cuccullata TaxID=36930 RepID=UPI002ED505E8
MPNLKPLYLHVDITSNFKLPAGVILGNVKTRRDCEEILQQNPSTRRKDGVYTIYPDRRRATRVYCDMTTDGGGWTVIQRRFDGQTDFRKKWNDYKKGFGDVSKEYWLGNDLIHALTSGRNQVLRINMKKFSGSMVYAQYSRFSVARESNKYRLTISGYKGNAGDMLIRNHNLNGMYFSTMDRDNDASSRGHCADSISGGWWYKDCTYAFLNRIYPPSDKKSSGFLFWGRNFENMKTTKMMIRSKN